MEAAQINDFDQLEREWQEIAQRMNEIRLPGFGERTLDLTNYAVLQRMVQHNPGVVAELRRRVPELLVHPFFTFPTTILDTLTPAIPLVSPNKFLSFNHPTGVYASSYHSDDGIAYFNSRMMGNLGSALPGVELTYQFPNEMNALSYEVSFKIWMYNQDFVNSSGADFSVTVSNYWGPVMSTTPYHVPLPGSEFAYLKSRVRAHGPNGVNGKNITIKIEHVDWNDSPIIWEFHSVTVSKTHLGIGF